MLAFLSVVPLVSGVPQPSWAPVVDASVAIRPRIRGVRWASSIRAPVAIDLEQRVGDEADQHEPEQLPHARLPHARAGGVDEYGTRDSPVQQPSVAIAETVQGDAVFAV